jgi:hypothetical protein
VSALKIPQFFDAQGQDKAQSEKATKQNLSQKKGRKVVVYDGRNSS